MAIHYGTIAVVCQMVEVLVSPAYHHAMRHDIPEWHFSTDRQFQNPMPDRKVEIHDDRGSGDKKHNQPL
jgi:hypothetical protein